MNPTNGWRRLPPNWEVPPWEMPGGFRLDCEPHHEPMLRWLANVALLCVLSAIGLILAAPVLLLFANSLRALAVAPWLGSGGGLLGLSAWLLARRELAGMRAGRIDRSAEWGVRFARERGRAVFVVGLFFPVLYLVLAPW
jgi:hypothetical protein